MIREASLFYTMGPSYRKRLCSYPGAPGLGSHMKDPVPHSGHSFRIGATSMATARGIKDLLINIHGAGRAWTWNCVKIPRMVLQSKIDSVLPEQHAIVECTNRCCCIVCQK